MSFGYVQTFLLNGLSMRMRGTICLKALTLARSPDERLNGFDLATLGSS